MGEHSGEFVERIIRRCSDLEGFVWMLWRQGVITVEDGKALVGGEPVPAQFSEQVVASIEECNITQHEMWTERVSHFGRTEDQT
jgi:hypothetical protein